MSGAPGVPAGAPGDAADCMIPGVERDWLNPRSAFVEQAAPQSRRDDDEVWHVFGGAAPPGVLPGASPQLKGLSKKAINPTRQ